MKNLNSELNGSCKLHVSNILDLVPGSLFVLDVKSKKIIYSKILPSDLLVYSDIETYNCENDIIGQLLHPDDRIIVDRSIEELSYLREYKVNAIEVRLREKTGKYYWFEIKLAVFTRDNKNQAIQIIGLFNNINEIKNTKNALELSELSYRNLFNTIEDAIYVQDETGSFVDVNDGATKMYGYTRDEFIGKTPEFLSAEGKNDLNLLKEKLAEAFKGKPQNFEFSRQKALCFQGSNFQKETFSTALLGSFCRGL